MGSLHSFKVIRNSSGATMLEVSLIAALIAVICIPSLTYLGRNTDSNFNEVGHAIANSQGPVPSSVNTGSSHEDNVSSGPVSDDDYPGSGWFTDMGGAEGECC